MRRAGPLAAAALLAACLAGAPARAGQLDWADEALALRGGDAGGAPAVVLLDELEVDVARSGGKTWRRRQVVEIRTEKGREHAAFGAWYLDGSSEVVGLASWRIPAGEKRPAFLNVEPFDVAAYSDLHGEARLRLLALESLAEPGDVFLAEWTVRDESDVLQLERELQRQLPVRRARCRVVLPEGWDVTAVPLGGAAPEARAEGRVRSWEMRDLPWVDPRSVTSVEAASPRLGLTLLPPSEQGAKAGPVFRTWEDVSRWLAALADPSAAPTPAVAERAAQAVAGAQDALGRIRAIGRAVQALRYVSVQTGLGRGGGYRPSPAAQVLERSWGDCKDKTALMRAMLASAGLQSHAVACSATDPGYVQDSWPSPQQFDHSIVAVKVDAGVDAPGVVEHPSLGRLLFCDPTDPSTPIGHVPLGEQGGLALVATPAGAGLVRLPATSPDRHVSVATVRAELTAAGDLAGRVVDAYEGWQAIELRGLHGQLSEAEVRSLAERRLAGAAATARVLDVKVEQPGDRDALTLTTDISVPGFARRVGSDLLVLSPARLGVGPPPPRDCEDREAHFASVPARLERQLAVKLPDGFVVDELPEPVELEGPLARFTLTFREGEDRDLLAEEVTVYSAGLEPADRCGDVEAFERARERARAAAVVLARAR